MTPEQIDRVFGGGRLKMATGDHVEVFREAIAPGERRRYTKRFLATPDGDFGPWTEREWRILARLIGHGVRCVPDVVQFDGGAKGGVRLVQTYDAGVTVDQWATLLPIARDGTMRHHIFEDCAHWWALAHHCLAALNEIHALELVHLDIKADNICIPYSPADFDPGSPGSRLQPTFARLVLIDFAFSLVSRESLATPLPIGWQKDYDYQSPRLLKALDAGRDGDLEPTRDLDWRCDFYSLAAMLKRYLPADGRGDAEGDAAGWTPERFDSARSLVFRLRDVHDRDLSQWRPHAQLMDFTAARLDERELAASLDRGWTLALDAIAPGAVVPVTPITRIARPHRAAAVTPLTRIAPAVPDAVVSPAPSVLSSRDGDVVPLGSPIVAPIAVTMAPAAVRTRVARRGPKMAKALVLASAALVAVAAPSFVGNPESPLVDRARGALAALRTDLQTRMDSVVALATPSAAIPAAASAQQRSADFDARPASPAQETAVAAESAQAHDAHTAVAAHAAADEATSASAPNQVATAAAPPRSSTAATPAQASGTSTTTPDQSGVSPHSASAQSPAAPAQSSPTVASDESRVESPTVVPMGGKAASPSIAMRARPDAAANRVQAARRSTTSPTANAGNRPHAPSNAIASKSGHSSTSRQVFVRSAPVHSSPPQVRLAAASVAPPASQLNTQTPGVVSEAKSPSVEHQAAPSNATPTPSLATQSVSPTKEDQRIEAPPGPIPSGATESPPRDQRSPQATAKQFPAATKPQAQDEWHTLIATVLGALRNRNGPAAPVEERSMASAATSPDATARAPTRSALNTLPPKTAPATPATTPPPALPAAAASIPVSPPVPMNIEPVPPTLAASAIEQRTDAKAAPLPLSAAPVDTRGSTIAPSIPAPVRIAAPLAPEPAPERLPDNAPETWRMQARRVLAETVPRVAAQAEPDVARVLWAAALANHPYNVPSVVEAASGRWASESALIPVKYTAPAYARLLHNDARQALAAGRDVSDAINIELQAFGANPRDADIAGYLAFLHLRMKPAQPETARQLMLHAIAIRGSRRSTGPDDWGTLAVASALTGRETDAIRAFLTEVALSNNVDGSCYSALSAYASFGERLRVPVQVMLSRVHSLGRGYAYPSCAWPPAWNIAARSPGAY